MIKRLTWFIGGAIAGAAGAGAAKKKVKAKAAELAPAKVARQASQRVREAVADGRAAMRHKESELRARRDGRAASLDEIPGIDSVMVDGEPVDPSNVIVFRSASGDTSRPRRRRGA